MQIFEITLQYRMVRLGDADPLTKSHINGLIWIEIGKEG